jgi:hypothetical protein
MVEDLHRYLTKEDIQMILNKWIYINTICH